MIKKDLKEYSVLAIMIGTTLFGKMLGMVRDMLIANDYGISYEADAFFVASRIPNNFFDFALSAAVVSTFIPIFNRIMHRKGKEEAFKYANHFLSFAMAIAVVVSGILIIFPGPIVSVFGPGLSEEAAKLATTLTQYMAPVVIFATVTFTYVGLMQSFSHFTLPSAISIFSNLVVILYLIFMNPRFGLYGLAIAFSLGWFIQALIQMPVMKKEGFVFRPALHLKSEAMRDTLRMTGPVLVSTWAQPVNAMIITVLASFYAGGVSLMEYANRVYIIISGVLIYTITNYIFPKLSKTFSSDDRVAFMGVVQRSVILFLYFGIPIVFLVTLYSSETIQILFLRGAFTEHAAETTSIILSFFIWGLIGLGIKEILNRVYFAMGNTKLPLIITVIGILINIPLSLLLSSFMGLNGLALASTVSMTLVTMVMMVVAMRQNIVSSVGILAKTTSKIIIVDCVLFLAFSLLGISFGDRLLALVVELIFKAGVFMVLHVLILKTLKIGIPVIQMREL